MIKSFYNITLKDIILLDATKNANVLKKYWFIPLWLCHKQLEKLATEIFESIGSNTIDDLENEFDKLISYQKLQILQALYKALQIELDLKARINAWKIIMDNDYKESAQLEKVLSEVLKYTGIELKTPEDLKAFEAHVEFVFDKHNELFPKMEVEDQPKTKLTEVIYSIFNYMGEPFDENMRLIMFVDIKKMAEDRIHKSKNNDNGEQSGIDTD